MYFLLQPSSDYSSTRRVPGLEFICIDYHEQAKDKLDLAVVRIYCELKSSTNGDRCAHCNFVLIIAMSSMEVHFKMAFQLILMINHRNCVNQIKNVTQPVREIQVEVVPQLRQSQSS